MSKQAKGKERTEVQMHCPDCHTMLQNHGAESRGDGDMYDVWYCNDCHCVKYHAHAKYCQCNRCLSNGYELTGFIYWERVEDELNYDFFAPY